MNLAGYNTDLYLAANFYCLSHSEKRVFDVAHCLTKVQIRFVGCRRLLTGMAKAGLDSFLLLKLCLQGRDVEMCDQIV